MAAAQLRLLGILPLQFLPDAVQQLHVALLRVLLQRRDESPRHGARGLARDVRILRCLRILATGPHDDIRARGFGLFVALIRGVAGCGFLEEAHGSRSHAADVAAGIRRDNAKQALTGFFGQVGLFEYALGGIDVGQIEGGARVAGVEDGGQADTGL